jgi:hypothetical protein
VTTLASCTATCINITISSSSVRQVEQPHLERLLAAGKQLIVAAVMPNHGQLLNGLISMLNANINLLGEVTASLSNVAHHGQLMVAKDAVI